MGAIAYGRALSATSGTIAIAAQAALTAVKEDKGRGVIGEVAADIADLHANAKLAAALNTRPLFMAVEISLYEALLAGWEVEARFQEITAGVDVQNKGVGELLKRYPIMGHQPLDIAAYQARVWGYNCDGVIGLAASSTATADLPGGFANASETAARSAQSGAQEAVAAGAQACRAAVGFALQRASI